MTRTLLKLIPWALILLMGTYIFVSYKLSNKSSGDSTEVTNNMVVEKIVQIGKLELTKFYIKDILEQKEIKDWWFDSKIVLMIAGEVTGCIDLAKIDSTQIIIREFDVELTLPEPEICYYKIDHTQSKVYSIENEYFEQTKLVDKAYALAEKNIRDAAISMKILEHSKTQAVAFLTPLLSQLSGGKKVVIKFKKGE